MKVAWISDYPVEWLRDLPEPLGHLRRQHPATWAMGLLHALKQRPEVELHVFVLRGKVNQDVHFKQEGIHYHILKVAGLLRVLSFFWADTLVIRRAFRTVKPHLVHAWGVERGGALIASRLREPCIVTIQGILSWYCSVVPDVAPLQRLMAWMEPVSLRRARIVTAESSFAVRYIAERYSTTRVYRADYAPNKAFFGVQRAPQLHPPRIISVGTLGHGKGTDLLLHALNALHEKREFELTLVGASKPEYLNQLRGQLNPDFWKRVTIKSQLTPEEVAQELSQATFMAMPTRVDTGPTAAKEAVVAGVPVVGSLVGGMTDYITEGENGLLFPPDNVEALKECLNSAFDHPLFGAGMVLPGARERMQAILSPTRMAERFLNVYRDALGQTRHSLDAY